jgi:integrase
MPKPVHFTKAILDNFTCPEGKNDAYLKDSGQPGLLFRVRASGHRSFEVRKKLHGKANRTKIGDYPITPIAKARSKARDALTFYDKGIDPDAAERAEKAAKVTLGECLTDYLESRSSLKPNTRTAYAATISQYLSDWLNSPINLITRDAVEARHRKIGKDSESRANTTMRILRAVFNYAIAKYENERGEPLYIHNPVARLSHVKAWYPETRRRAYLNKEKIPIWFDAVDSLPEWMLDPRVDTETIRDFLKLVLLTGLRRREASNLRWENVDLDNDTLSIPGSVTKNKKEHVLPLPTYLIDMLGHRKANGSSFVFPGKIENTPISEPKRIIEAVRQKCGFHFTLHDLRRTFATMAEDAGVRDYTLKRLLNHSGGRDVTAGYYVPDVAALRDPMNRICSHILNISSQEFLLND